MVHGTTLLWNCVLVVQKVAGVPGICDIFVMAGVGWFIISV